MDGLLLFIFGGSADGGELAKKVSGRDVFRGGGLSLFENGSGVGDRDRSVSTILLLLFNLQELYR